MKPWMWALGGVAVALVVHQLLRPQLPRLAAAGQIFRAPWVIPIGGLKT